MAINSGSSAAGSTDIVHKVMVDLFCRNHCLLNSGVSVFYFNARSLNGTKLDEVRSIFENSTADIICVSETWFNPVLPNCTYEINNYKLFRNDRVIKRGGGVAIYCRNDFNSRLVNLSTETGVEFINVEISYNNFKALISCVYRPPNRQCCIDPFFSDLANRLVDYDLYLVCGDFNINVLSNDSMVGCLYNNLYASGLKLVNDSVPTRYDINSVPSLLDHILVSDLAAIIKFDQSCFVSDHDLLFCSVNMPIGRAASIANTCTIRDYKNVNVEALFHDMTSVVWNDCWAYATVDEKLHWFMTMVSEIFERHVPIKTITFSNRSSPWFNAAVKSAIKKRNILHSKWRSCVTDSNWLRYTKARNHANFVIKSAKTRYYSLMLGSMNSTKMLWRNIRKLRIFKKDSEPCVLSAGSLIRQFTGDKSNNVHCISLSPLHSCEVEYPFYFSSISESEVAMHFSSITSDAVGYDGLPIRFLKLVLPVILPTLTHIINHCFTTSMFPSTWKMATITPIAKKSKPMLPCDFRPISILPSLAKVCERAMASQINEYLSANALLSPMQSGFRRGHSCTTTMLKILEDLRVPYDNKQITLLCLLDFSKAFDNVDHSLLCHKLKSNFHFGGSATALIANYLVDRFQRVKVGDSYSVFANVATGVPQGSTLGPLLFSLFINDIFSTCNYVRLHAFADDVQLYISDSMAHVGDLVIRLNNDLSKIHHWATENHLALNTGKSMVLPIRNQRFSFDDIPPVLLGNTALSLVSTARNLGIIINSKLSCCDHINLVIPKVYSLLRVLRYTADYTPVAVRRNLVMQLVMPHFTYFSVIYSKLDSVSLNKLVVVFNNVTRYVYSLRRFDHISGYESRILGVKFVQYLEIRNMVFLHSIINTESPRYLFNGLSFGQSARTQQLIIPVYKTLGSSRFFFVNAVKLWNLLPLSVRNIANINAFKKAIYAHYE